MSGLGTLIKFSQHEHVLQLQNEGLLYMNNLAYFRRIEDEELRGDSFDGVTRVERARNTKVEMKLPDGREITIKEAKWVLGMDFYEPERINIFCMYALHAGSFPVDEKNFRFGDYALVLTSGQEFMNRVVSTMKTQIIKEAKGDLVEYVDNQFTRELGPLKKFKTFDYQSEWRLVCYDGPGGVRKISIGSIRDISVIIPSSEVNRIITISS